MNTDTKKIIFFFFLISFLFKPLWLFEYNSIEDSGDDIAYWIHSATLAFDFDIDYKDDFKSEKVLVNNETNSPIHYPGSGYLASPFVFLFSTFDNLIDKEIDRLNPVGTFSYLGYFFSTLIYTYFGFYLIYKTLKKYNNIDKNFIFIAFLGTLVHFVVTRFLMAHAVEFFLCAALIYLFETKKNFSKDLDLIILTTVFFFLLITRPSTFLYSTVLFFVYRKKFMFSRVYKNYFWIIFLILKIYLYQFISLKLYGTRYFFLSNYGNQVNLKYESVIFETFVDGLLRSPSLFFSYNMGLMWTMPIIIFALFGLFKISSNFSYKLNMFLYFFGAFSVLFIWQGKEISFGQRLLIGTIPVCLLLISKSKIQFKKIYLVVPIWSYLGYLYFYSSKLLTLTSGTSLWGTEVGFTAPNYYLNVFKNLLNFENIGFILFKNIYSVNFLNIFGFDSLPDNIVSFIPENLFLKALEYSTTYESVDLYFLLLTNLLIFIFSISLSFLLIKKFKV